MSYRIKKPALKWAWGELQRLGFDPAAEESSGLLTAAALTALCRWGGRLEWLRALPPATGLEFESRRVMLAFDPKTPLAIRFPLPEEACAEAARRFAGDRAGLEKPLQVLALSALEPNFEWLSEPPVEDSP